MGVLRHGALPSFSDPNGVSSTKRVVRRQSIPMTSQATIPYIGSRGDLASLGSRTRTPGCASPFAASDPRERKRGTITGPDAAAAGGLEATTLEFGRSPKAVNVDEECPAEFRPCVGMLSFPQWEGGFYSEGGPFHVRMIAVDATWGGESHGLYAMISAADDAVFAEFAPAATEMIEGARLPEGVGT